MIAPMVLDCSDASAFAAPFGTQLSVFAACVTRSRSSADTMSGELMARETEAVDTPANRATSRSRTGAALERRARTCGSPSAGSRRADGRGDFGRCAFLRL